MKKLAFALSMIMTAGAALPSFAASGLDYSVGTGLLVTRTVGAGSALVVGTPISVVRHTAKSHVTMTTNVADKIGGHEFGPSALIAAIVTAPAAVVIGGGKGVIGGTKTAAGGFNTPFKTDSFSIGALEE